MTKEHKSKRNRIYAAILFLTLFAVICDLTQPARPKSHGITEAIEISLHSSK